MRISKSLAGLACAAALFLGTGIGQVAHADESTTAASQVQAAVAPAAKTQTSSTAAPKAAVPTPKKATVKVKKAPTSVRTKAQFTVSGTATAKGAKASLQYWTGKKWSTIATGKVTSKGTFSLKGKITKVGKTKLRVVTAATATHLTAKSTKPVLKVRDTKAKEAVAFAMAKVGKPYRYGSAGPNAFDCSGLTSYAYGKAGVKLARTSRAQLGKGKSVKKKDLKPGDLVFFYSPVSHVAIYIGNGNVVHAGNARTGVNVTKLKYMPFSGARRVA